ncbi:MAG: hypothetical protein JSR97_12160 [Verrucomicrobia bacterium]|nr:hypothetical protein [Verrucomicrobiota bacterium]
MSTKTKRKFLLLTEKGMQLTLGLPKYGLTLVIFGICNSTVLHIGLDIYYLAFVCYLHLQFFNHHRYRADGILIPVLRQALSVTGHAKRRHDKHNRTVKRQTKCQPFAKLKELQADTQANAFAAHLILPNRTQSPPTTRPVDG